MRRAVRIVVLGLIAWIGVCAVLVVLGALEARRGVGSVDRIGDSGLTALLGDGSAFAPAAAHFERADAYLSSPLLTPVSQTPFFGTQLRSMVSMVEGGERVVEAADREWHAVATELDAGLTSGPDRVRFLASLVARFERLRVEVQSTDPGPSVGLFGPAADTRRRFDRQIVRAAERLDEAVEISKVLHDIVVGPSSYLVLAANNAEMRVGSGMFLSAGHLEIQDGRLALGDFEPARNFVRDDPVSVPPALERLWGWAEPGRDLRSLGLSPFFDDNAPVAARLWEESGRPQVDGVILLDVVALRDLLGAVGPLRVDGIEVSEGTILRQLLIDQYTRLRTPAQNGARRERLDGVAGAVFERIDSGEVRLERLGASLARATAGRHVLVWSRDRHAQGAWSALRTDGTVGRRAIAVGVANADASKLDPFVHLESALSNEDIGDDSVEMTMRITVDNRASGDEAPYVIGPDGDADYQGVVVVYLPTAAVEVESAGEGPLVVSGVDRGRPVLAHEVQVGAGQRAVFTVRFVLRAEHVPGIRVMPTARVAAYPLSVLSSVLGRTVAPTLFLE